MIDPNIKRKIRKEAVRIIQHAEEGKQTAPEEIAIKLIQLLQKNSPRDISDSTKLIEKYLYYLNRLIGIENKTETEGNERKIFTALSTNRLHKVSMHYNYNGKEVAVNQDLAKLAVRILSTYMRTANLLEPTEIALAYQKIYNAILNSVVPRYI